MKAVLGVLCLIACAYSLALDKPRDYRGYKVLSITPKKSEDVKFLKDLRQDYSVDLWSEPAHLEQPIMTHLSPDMVHHVVSELKTRGIEYNVAFDDLQNVIDNEKVSHSPTKSSNATAFNFGIYNQLDQIENLMRTLATSYPKVAQLETAGKSYENRPIYSLKIAGGASKPAIMIDCGIHAREWSSVAACAYFVNKLITTYGSDPEVTSLLDKYEFDVILEANPDGYVYTWTNDRLWRKTRSRSSIDWLGVCRGADANRNFDIQHCGVGTSRKPCDDIYCGDSPFSESEARTIRDMMINLAPRLKGYFSVHAFSQLWMTPFGIHKALPQNYAELQRIGQAGVTALARKYGTQYRLGSIANIIYEAAGSTIDYIYVKQNVKIAYALELRDTGRYGFFLPQQQILPMCEETYDGLVASIKAI